jgi:serine/threonine protein kinase
LDQYRKQFDGNKLEEPDCARVFAQLCAALEYTHSRNICHRDIKLDNVLLYQGTQEVCECGNHDFHLTFSRPVRVTATVSPACCGVLVGTTSGLRFGRVRAEGQEAQAAVRYTGLCCARDRREQALPRNSGNPQQLVTVYIALTGCHAML